MSKHYAVREHTQKILSMVGSGHKILENVKTETYEVEEEWRKMVERCWNLEQELTKCRKQLALSQMQYRRQLTVSQVQWDDGVHDFIPISEDES